MPESQHTIAGTVLTMPIRVRKADVHSAMFSVDADAAQRLVDYSGLEGLPAPAGPRCRQPSSDPVRRLRPRAVQRVLDLRDGAAARIECPRAARARHGRHLRAPHDGRRGFHAGGGQTDLGLPEGPGGLHRSRRQPVRVRRQRRRIACRRDGDRSRAAGADAVASAIAAHLHQPRRHDPRNGRRTAVVGIPRPHRRRRPSGWAITRSPRSSHRSGCPRRRSPACRSPTPT